MKRLNSWFEIDEHQYLMYLLKGYQIEVHETYVAWRLNDKYHREDGPAYINATGTQRWYFHNKLHSIDGPAIIWANSSKEWFINGKKYTEAEFNEEIKQLV